MSAVNIHQAHYRGRESLPYYTSHSLVGDQQRHVDVNRAALVTACTTGQSANLPLTDITTPTHHLVSRSTTAENRQNQTNNHHLNPARPLSPRDPNTPVADSKRSLRKPSPRLLERLHLLSGARKRSSAAAATTTTGTDQTPGRIPDSYIQLLDKFHSQNREIVVDKRGTAWSGPQAQQSALGAAAPRLDLVLDGHPQLPAEGGSGGLLSLFTSPMAGTVHESDASSIISVSDRLVPSDSEPELDLDPHTDTQKYRLPDLGKSRGSSRNGFVLEDGSVIDRERAPTPPPKDFPLSYESPSKEDNYPYFHPGHMSRTASIYTLSLIHI